MILSIWNENDAKCNMASLLSDIWYFYTFQNDLDDPERGMIFVCSATHKTKVV